LPGGDATGVYGTTDVLGSLNRLTDERVLEAVREVRTGRVCSLNAPLDWPDPPLFTRGAVSHTVVKTAYGHDDYLDAFYPQASSQWDGFRHVRHPDEETYYNHRPDAELGIETWARRGIVGRGVLLDVARHRAAAGRTLDWRSADVITVADLEGTAVCQRVAARPGDVLLVRTGWTAGYRAADPEFVRTCDWRHFSAPGLEGSDEMAARLWDWQISAIASDNPALEVIPSGLAPLHRHLLVRLGIPIGELWWLDELAQACEELERYSFLFTSAPQHVIGGVGSSANALAIL
jgi:kynurenine formamidase